MKKKYLVLILIAAVLFISVVLLAVLRPWVKTAELSFNGEMTEAIAVNRLQIAMETQFLRWNGKYTISQDADKYINMISTKNTDQHDLFVQYLFNGKQFACELDGASQQEALKTLNTVFAGMTGKYSSTSLKKELKKAELKPCAYGYRDWINEGDDSRVAGMCDNGNATTSAAVFTVNGYQVTYEVRSRVLSGITYTDYYILAQEAEDNGNS